MFLYTLLVVLTDLAAHFLGSTVFRQHFHLLLSAVLMFGPALSFWVSQHSIFAKRSHFLYRWVGFLLSLKLPILACFVFLVFLTFPFSAIGVSIHPASSPMSGCRNKIYSVPTCSHKHRSHFWDPVWHYVFALNAFFKFMLAVLVRTGIFSQNNLKYLNRIAYS